MAKTKSKDMTGWGLLAVRVVTGLVFLLAGWSKLSASGADGWIGPAGFAGMISALPAAAFFAWLVALVEFIGGILLILGVLSRWTIPPLGLIMIVATIWKWTGGFGGPSWNAWRFDLLLIAVLFTLYYAGNGKWTLNSMWK